MLKHKVKYRVVGSDRIKRKYSINLDDGATFTLTRELLEGGANRGSSTPLCSLQVQAGALRVIASSNEIDMNLNGKRSREFEVRPGDFAQVDEFAIEFLECPHAARNETNATQFLDVSEMSPSLPSDRPETVLDESPNPKREQHHEDSPKAQQPQRPQQKRHAPLDREEERFRSKLETQKQAPAKRERARKYELEKERQAPAPIPLNPEHVHLATSVAMAAAGAAGITRVIISASSQAFPVTVVLYAAIAAIPGSLALSWGMTRVNPFLGTSAHQRDYARFFGWTLICCVPWAYTLGTSFPMAMFTTLLMISMVGLGFVARFRPHVPRLAGLGAGVSVFAIGLLYWSFHHGQNVESIPVVAAVTPPAAEPAAVAPVPAPAQEAAPVQAQAAAPVQIESAVNDTIPAIPGKGLTQPATTRQPAAADPEARNIVDPLAHEQFFSAIKAGNLDVVKSLIERKAVDPDFTLDRGNTPLIAAAAQGKVKVVEYLLKRRVNINAQDPHGTTALMWAVFKGHREVAKLLVKKGANTEVRRDDGDSALDIARKWKQGEIAELIQDRQGERAARNRRRR